MKRLISVLIILIAAASSALSQTAPDAAKLTALLNEFLAGAGRNDAAVHERFWAEDLIYTRSTGVRTNKEEIMKGLRSATPAPRKDTDPVTVYTGDQVQIHQYGDTAVVAFRLVITATKSDGTKTVNYNLNTGTFVRRKGIWQAVAWQSTVVPKPEATSQISSSESKTAQLLSAPTTPGARTYLKGSKGGCYYLAAGGAKVYVDHKFCN